MGYVTNAKGQTNWETSPGNTVLKDSVFDPGSKNYNATVANSGGKIALSDLDSGSPNGLSAAYNAGNGANSASSIAARDRANQAASIMSASNSAIGGHQYNPASAQATPPYVAPTPSVDYAAQAQANAKAQADTIAKAQADALASLKTTSDNQLQATINPYKTAQANIPTQTTALNNQASNQGMVNAQHIRNALAQMGLLQSGESASQQLANDTSTANNINANNLAAQQLDASYNDKIAAATAQNASDYNKQAYQYGRDNTADNQWNQTFAENKAQNAIKNAQAQQQINNQASQFAQSFGLSQQQLANTINQQGIDNLYRNTALAQSANQFAQQMGLSRDQYASGLDQWAKTFAQTQAQDAIKNAQNDATLTGTYNGADTLAKRAQAIQDAQFKASLEADNANKAAALAASLAKASTPKALTATQIKNNLEGSAYDEINNQLASGNSPENVISSITSQWGSLVSQGLNPDQMIKYIQSHSGKVTPGKDINGIDNTTYKGEGTLGGYVPLDGSLEALRRLGGGSI